MKRIILLTTLFLIFMAASPALAAFQKAPPAAGGYKVQILVDASQKRGIPNSVVTFNVTVINSGTRDDTYTIAYPSVPGWRTWTIPQKDNFALKAGKSIKFQLKVEVPEGAPFSDSNLTTFSVSSAHGAAASVELTTVADSANPSSTVRPIIVLQSYSTASDPRPDNPFTLNLEFANRGQSAALNMIVSFESGDFSPRDTGGVRVVQQLGANKSVEFSQEMWASMGMWDKSAGLLVIKVTYSDDLGEGYSESFTLTLNMNRSTEGTGATATPTGISRAQIVVSSYQASVDPLQPGSMFDLDLEILNVGSAPARSVTMVLGGGAQIDTASGTPVPGGTSGGSGELTNFAPLGSSNIISLGDVNAGSGWKAKPRLIVNVTTNPGAYPFKISFLYTDSKGNRVVDEQVITLLVYSLPQVEVNFYRDPGMFMAGQPSVLPLQVTNLGRKTAVLGNLKISARGAELTNNVGLVGSLEPGGYFTLDANFTPQEPGEMSIDVVINYTDDFNQARTITQSVPLTVEEMPTPEPMLTPGAGEGWEGGMPAEESFWDKVLRFLKGLVGLDSTQPQPQPEFPLPEENAPKIPAPGGGGGGGGKG